MLMFVQLKRITAEATAKSKRERRRANEIKAKTIQRMQLQMVAPMDIGLDFKDQALEMGQEDVFDLSTQEKVKSKKLGDNVIHPLDEDADESENEEEDGVNEEDEDHRVSDLENELDGLYDAYRERKAGRDSKFKVKEARKKNKAREEKWEGFDDVERSEDEESDGGWEQTASRKAKMDDDSSEDDDDLGSNSTLEGSGDDINVDEQPLDRVRKAKLLTKLDVPGSKLQPSKAAQIWFSQSMFKDVVTDLDKIPEDILPNEYKPSPKAGKISAKSEVSRCMFPIKDVGY